MGGERYFESTDPLDQLVRKRTRMIVRPNPTEKGSVSFNLSRGRDAILETAFPGNRERFGEVLGQYSDEDLDRSFRQAISLHAPLGFDDALANYKDERVEIFSYDYKLRWTISKSVKRSEKESFQVTIEQVKDLDSYIIPTPKRVVVEESTT